jgi:hypothetical protein
MNGVPSDFRERLSRPCWYCHFWGGTSGSSHGLCARPGGNVKQAQPRMGCAFYEREPGVDDDGWTPTWDPLPVLKAPARRGEGPRNEPAVTPLTVDTPSCVHARFVRSRTLAAGAGHVESPRAFIESAP